MSSLTVYARYDSQEKAWDAVLRCGGMRLEMAVTTAWLYGLAGRPLYDIPSKRPHRALRMSVRKV